MIGISKAIYVCAAILSLSEARSFSKPRNLAKGHTSYDSADFEYVAVSGDPYEEPTTVVVPGVPGAKGSKRKGVTEYVADYAAQAKSGKKGGKKGSYDGKGGKGGKGGSSSSSSSSKGKKGGKGGSSSKGSSSNDGNKPGQTHYPTASPAPSITAMPSRDASRDASSDQERSPISLPQQDTNGGLPQPGQAGLSGRSPASRTDADSIPRDSSQYALLFTMSENSMPSQSDIAEASNVTTKFLEDFMFTLFSRTEMTNLDGFVNQLVTSSYTMEGPSVVEFTSTARFDPTSFIVPLADQIDESLEMAFEDGSSYLLLYISLLQALPRTNVFSSTTSVAFALGPTLKISTPTKKSGSAASGAGIAAAAVAATLLVAGFVIYKRRSYQEQEESKGVKKTNGAATVAGDTYTGETVSITASSLDYGGSRYRDEETGGIHTLEAIREIYDDSSVTPAWDDGSMNGQDQAYAQAKKSNEEDVSETEGTIELSEEDNSQGEHNDTGSTGDDSTMSGGTASSSSRSDAEDRSASYQDPYLDATYNGANSFGGIERSANSGIPSQMNDGEGSLTSHGSHGNGSIEGKFVSTDSTKEPSSAEIGSLLSYDLDHLQKIEQDSDSSKDLSYDLDYLQEIELDSEEQEKSQDIFLKKADDASARHRTVSEIESLLSADLDDESEYTAESGFNDELVPFDDCSAPSQRPRTVSEIESLLSADLDDDVQMV